MSTTAEPRDPWAILAALGVHEAASVRPVAGGWDTALWRVEHDGVVSALRIFPPGREMSCQLEVAAMHVAAEAGLPVPEIRAKSTLDDRPALLLEWMPGRVLFDALRRRPRHARALGVAFGRMQARLHALPVLAGSPLRTSQRLGWVADLAAVQADIPQRERRPDALLHLDFHPLNVMVRGDEVSAILDWANATIGDPRADIARTLSILRFVRMGPWLSRMQATTVLRPFTAGYLHAYQLAAGPLGDMAPFRAWAADALVRDLAPKVGHPGIWLTERHLERLRRQM